MFQDFCGTGANPTDIRCPFHDAGGAIYRIDTAFAMLQLSPLFTRSHLSRSTSSTPHPGCPSYLWNLPRVAATVSSCFQPPVSLFSLAHSNSLGLSCTNASTLARVSTSRGKTFARLL